MIFVTWTDNEYGYTELLAPDVNVPIRILEVTIEPTDDEGDTTINIKFAEVD